MKTNEKKSVLVSWTSGAGYTGDNPKNRHKVGFTVEFHIETTDIKDIELLMDVQSIEDLKKAIDKLAVSQDQNFEVVSNCCGAAPISNGDKDSTDFGICPDCGEHCDYIEANEDQD